MQKNDAVKVTIEDIGVNGEGIGKISVSGTRIDKKHINRIGIGTRSTP